MFQIANTNLPRLFNSIHSRTKTPQKAIQALKRAMKCCAEGSPSAESFIPRAQRRVLEHAMQVVLHTSEKEMNLAQLMKAHADTIAGICPAVASQQFWRYRYTRKFGRDSRYARLKRR